MSTLLTLNLWKGHIFLSSCSDSPQFLHYFVSFAFSSVFTENFKVGVNKLWMKIWTTHRKLAKLSREWEKSLNYIWALFRCNEILTTFNFCVQPLDWFSASKHIFSWISWSRSADFMFCLRTVRGDCSTFTFFWKHKAPWQRHNSHQFSIIPFMQLKQGKLGFSDRKVHLRKSQWI